jgi:uroporphyrinogen decarboxylase
MNSRERVFTALEHESPDRVPLDCFDIMPSLLPPLKEYYNAKNRQELMLNMGVDIITTTMDPPEDFQRINFPKLEEDWCVSSWAVTLLDEFGIKVKTTGEGEYWVYSHHPLQDSDNLENFEFPDVGLSERWKRVKKDVERFRKYYPIAGMLEVTLLEHAEALRGYQQFFKDLYINKKFVSNLLDKLLEYKIKIAKKFVELGVDIIRLGDDLGMQTGLIISPALWREFFKPRMKEIINEIKKGKDTVVYYHTCGYVEPLIPELIEIGVDILNPIQPDCNDPIKIKTLYGDLLTLHGTISVQETLPFRTVNEVKRIVTERIEKLGKNGGLILAPAHVIGNEVPVDNVTALYDTARRYKMEP